MNLQLMQAELASELAAAETQKAPETPQAEPQPDSTSQSPHELATASEPGQLQAATPQPAAAGTMQPPKQTLRRKRKKTRHDRFLEISATHRANGDGCITVHGKGARQWRVMPDDFQLGDTKTGLWVGSGVSIGVGDDRTLVVVSVGKGGDANPSAVHWKGILYDPTTDKCFPKALDWVKYQVSRNVVKCAMFVLQNRSTFWEWRERPNVDQTRMQAAYKEFLARVESIKVPLLGPAPPHPPLFFLSRRKVCGRILLELLPKN